MYAFVVSSFGYSILQSSMLVSEMAVMLDVGSLQSNPINEVDVSIAKQKMKSRVFPNIFPKT